MQKLKTEIWKPVVGYETGRMKNIYRWMDSNYYSLTLLSVFISGVSIGISITVIILK